MTALLLLSILLPIAGALTVYWLRGSRARAGALIATGAAALCALVAAWVNYPESRGRFFAGLPWLGDRGGAQLLGVLLDPLGTILLVVAMTIGFLTVLYSTRYLREANREHPVGEPDQARYYFWLLAFVGSMAGVATAPNFLQLFVFWEMTTVCSWALISYHHSERSLRAGFQAILMTHVGGLFFLGALLVLFAQTGSFAFDAPASLTPGLRAVVFVFLLVAAWAKAAQVPFHTWLPDAMEAPTPVSAYLHAAAMVKAGVFLMARAVASGWEVPPAAGGIMSGMAMVTILIALTFYFVQDDLKRLLAYSTIAHLGYVLLGLSLGALGSTTGLRGGVLHLICHSFAKATLFFAVGAVAYVTGSRSIKALGGVARVMPLTATAYFVGVLAVTGIPPFACFWSKVMILEGALDVGGLLGAGILAFVLAESLIAFGWMLRVGFKVFMGEQTELARVHSDPPPAMSATLVVLMIAALVVPVVGIPLVKWIGG